MTTQEHYAKREKKSYVTVEFLIYEAVKTRCEYFQETVMKQTLFPNIIGIDIWPAEVDLYQVSLKDVGKVVRRHKPGEPSQQMRKEREKSALYLNFFLGDGRK